MFALDWNKLFVPSGSLLEVVVRGATVYLTMFVIMRLFRRQAGAIGIADLLVIVVIADAAQNGMAGEYKSITEGVLLIATITACDFVIDWLSFRVRFIERLVRPAPLLLIKMGQIMRSNMRQELITDNELQSLLRSNGIQDMSDIEAAFLEPDGKLSVIQSGHSASKSRHDDRLQ